MSLSSVGSDVPGSHRSIAYPCDPDKVAAGLSFAPALLAAATVEGGHPDTHKTQHSAAQHGRAEQTITTRAWQ